MSAFTASMGSPSVVVTEPPSITSMVLPLLLMTFFAEAPRKLYLPHFSPPSTLSRRNASAPSLIFMKAETGVSVSARMSLKTGTMLLAAAFSRKTSREGEWLGFISN